MLRECIRVKVVSSFLKAQKKKKKKNKMEKSFQKTWKVYHLPGNVVEYAGTKATKRFPKLWPVSYMIFVVTIALTNT